MLSNLIRQCLKSKLLAKLLSLDLIKILINFLNLLQANT
jgi:hypothetical protein